MLTVQDRIDLIAGQVLEAVDRKTSIAPITGTHGDFGLADAYCVSGHIMRSRTSRGARPVGWKIGFTNRAIWDEYDVHAPIWGPMYDTTVAMVDGEGVAFCDLSRLIEPRIEPEIVFRLSATPRPGMDERTLLSFIDAVGHGVEIVQSVFPAWKFAAADTVAAFALHGLYRCGPLLPVSAHREADWLEMLSRFEIYLFRNGEAIDRGHAMNVLDGPLSALKHLVDGFDEAPFGRGLQAGDLVTTGTVTRAFPVQPGEAWTTEIIGLPLPGLALRF